MLQTIFLTYEKNQGNQFSEPEIVQVERHLVYALQALDKKEEVSKIAQRIYERLTTSRNAGPHHEFTLDMMYFIARMLFEYGKVVEAKNFLHLLKEALLTNLNNPKSDSESIKIASEVAWLYYKMGESATAFELCNLVYQKTKNCGKSQATLLDSALKSWQLMGKLHSAKGRHKEAYSMSETVFKKCSEVFGENSFNALLARVIMSALDRRVNFDCVKNILEDLNKAEQLQPGDPDVMNTQQYVISWFEQMGRIEEAHALVLDFQAKSNQTRLNKDDTTLQCINEWADKLKRLRDLNRFVGAMHMFGFFEDSGDQLGSGSDGVNAIFSFN